MVKISVTENILSYMIYTAHEIKVYDDEESALINGRQTLYYHVINDCSVPWSDNKSWRVKTHWTDKNRQRISLSELITLILKLSDDDCHDIQFLYS